MSEISAQKNYITHEILRGGPAAPQGILGEVVRAFHKKLTHGAAEELHTPSWRRPVAASPFAASFVRGGGLGFRL